MPGGGVVIKQVVEEKENAYPENRMFGNSLPASGMYIRHAKNIGLHNIQWYTRTPDQRPVFWLEDTEGAVINNPYVNGRQPGQSLTKLVQAKNVTLAVTDLNKKCRPMKKRMQVQLLVVLLLLAGNGFAQSPQGYKWWHPFDSASQVLSAMEARYLTFNTNATDMVIRYGLAKGSVFHPPACQPPFNTNATDMVIRYGLAKGKRVSPPRPANRC